MALNPFFLQGSQGEQRLVQELINEQLKIYGVEVNYIPRKIIGRSKLFGINDLREITSSSFDSNFFIEAYVQNFEGYSGSGDILTKFGMSLRDELTLVISKERYEDFISPFMDSFPDDEVDPDTIMRPREGDLIYFPLGQRLFEIKFVEHENPFYQLGKNYVYELKCELFEYEDEVLDTSIDEIDRVIENDGYITTLILSGLGVTATATASQSTGYVRQIYLNSDGYGYTSPPLITFSDPPDGGTKASAVAITTSKGKVYSISEILLTNAGMGYTIAPTITILGGGGSGAAATCGIDTVHYGVQRINIDNIGQAYTKIPLITVSTPTSVGASATVGIDTLGRLTSYYINNSGKDYDPNKTPAVAISTAPFSELSVNAEGFARVNSLGNVYEIVFTNPGFGYTQPPSISISNQFSDKIGIATAILKADISANGGISTIRIVDPGAGYLQDQAVITIENPPRINGIGTYQFNEEVIGSLSGTKARVKSWDSDTRILKVALNSGKFYKGENITGSESSAVFSVASYDQTDVYDPYEQNDEIEQIADQLIDFSESNPFGNY